MNYLEVSEDSPWNFMSDDVILQIFKYLEIKDLLNAGLVCTLWNRISYDEILWKSLFYKNFKIDSPTPLAPGKKSWYEEYKRLIYEVPSVCTESIRLHNHEVLHVSCSHDGTLFATSSKDGLIIVWKLTDPVRVKHIHDMKLFSWKYTQYSQFNKSDTLLLVSGVHFGSSQSTSGEVAVFSLIDNKFELQCRVSNKPYDIFGTWFNDKFLLSGDLYWQNHLESTTEIWISKASQEVQSERTPILNRLFRFYNINASSVRRIMVADLVAKEEEEITSNATSSPECSKKEKSQNVDSPKICEGENCSSCDDSDCDEDIYDLSNEPEKILIFITGCLTYTPHQIGLKKVKGVKFPVSFTDYNDDRDDGERFEDELIFDMVEREKYDTIDAIIDMDGHIIGISLSPDHRYLYVNCRSWPEGYRITNPLDPPPIASEIDIHVIDLKTCQQVGKLLRSHKAYTPNNECFFVLLDVSEEYVASGAEDKFGYIWDRHYGACLAKYPHDNIVNCVAFNPKDSSTLITTSDDYLIKVWHSKKYCNLNQNTRKFEKAVFTTSL